MPVPKGTRIGGRSKGTLNKRTQEELMRRAAEVAQSKAAGRRLGRDALSELMAVAMTEASRLQRQWLMQADAEKPDLAIEARFQKWLEMAGVFAKAVAPFESPTYKAIQVVPPPPEPAALRKDVDAKVISIDDPAALARQYAKLIGKVNAA